MSPTPPDPRANELFARAVVARIVGAGTTQVFVAPGSRSTPLVAAFRASGVPMTLVTDERAAGFAAIGVARTGGRACVVTTSGTAVANLLPAMAEADVDELAWIACTADRPSHLVGIGANQTLDQPPLLAGAARAVVDLPAPPDFDGNFGALERALAVLDGASPGPVHLNVRFQKPLEPTNAGAEPLTPIGERAQAPWSRTPPDPFADAENGLVVVGALPFEDRPGVESYLSRVEWPVVVDVTSGLARGGRFRAAMFRHAVVREALTPDRCLWIGGRATEPALARWLLARRVPTVQWKSTDRVRDPESLFQASHRVALRHALPDPSGATSSGLVDKLMAITAAEPELERKLSEPFVARTVAESVRTDEPLFVGNSMVVRDVDRFARRSSGTIVTNRGASGIDGNLATALGAWKETGLPTTALVGDLAFLHDSGTLATIVRERAALRIVVVNNHGGGIFHFLPIAQHTGLFEPWFGAPHGADAVAIARGHGLVAERIDSPDELERRLEDPPGGPELLEVITDRESNRALHVAMDRAWVEALESAR